jgi:hypothetical protein
MKTETEILAGFARIKAYRGKTGPALHKPLLLLFMLSRCLRGEPRLASLSLRPEIENSSELHLGLPGC